MEQPTASFEELAQELVFREHQIALLQVEASMLAAELSQNGFLEREGYNSPTDWLRFNCHLTDKVASDRINVGDHLAKDAAQRGLPARRLDRLQPPGGDGADGGGGGQEV